MDLILTAKFRAAMVARQNHRPGPYAVLLSCILTIANGPVSEQLDQRVLAAHNRVREQFGVPPLRWDPGLAALAAARANQLAAAHIFAHTTENSLSPQGENIWGGTKGYYSPEDMVNAWIEEKRYFKPGIFPDNSTTGKIDDVGHFTQLIWRNTSEVGCAAVDDGQFDILVCRYSPAGNFTGERPF